jgi:hypothetical protein
MEALNVDQLTNSILNGANNEVAKLLEAECILVNSGMFPPLDDQFRVAIEELREGDSTIDHLVVLLETSGGVMEIVERLVAVMRHHYSKVSFVIPNYAYSAGTVLALSGDHIYMDYYSVLGPIDPQVRASDGNYIPGHGMIAKFNELRDTINSATSPEDVIAELTFLTKNFDPGQIFQIEQSIQHGITLITEWLPKYKFKDWKETEGAKTRVTDKMKKDRAESIAKTLGDASKWHSHGRGIPMSRLVDNELKLKIDDFGDNKDLSSHIKNYHGLAIDYYAKIGFKDYIHTRMGCRRIA